MIFYCLQIIVFIFFCHAGMARESNFFNQFLYEYTSTDDLISKKGNKTSTNCKCDRAATRETNRMADATIYFGSTAHFIRPDMDDRPIIEFCSGSSYLGEWNQFGMCGRGYYTFPNGVQFQGVFQEGNFHGKGKLIYPNGVTIHAIWKNGKVKKPVLIFEDGLRFKKHFWRYCEYPDRRYRTCIENGIPAVGLSYIAPTRPARFIPQGCYDTIDGIFNPKLKIIYNPDTRRIIRIPTTKECEWILQHCRRGTLEEIPPHRKPVRIESDYSFAAVILKHLSKCSSAHDDSTKFSKISKSM